MSNITLRQMRYFGALARSGHFGRAAADCAITQPALSMQIKELEESLRVHLFERTPRRLRLTAFGESLLERTEAILRAVDELEDLARAAQERLTGQLRLGVIPTVAPYLLPRLIGRISADLPDLELNLRETITPRLITDLLDGHLDAAIVALPVSEPALTEVPLFSEDFVLVRPAQDKDLPVPDPEGLREMRLLLLEEGHCFRDQALSFCNTAPARAREVMDGSSLTTLVQMVGAGIGVTLVPEMAVATETRSAPVSVARFPHPAPQRTIGMVWRRTSPLAERLREIAALVARVAALPPAESR